MAFTKPTMFFLVLFLTMFIACSVGDELGRVIETRMTLYFHDYSGGSNTTVIQITNPTRDSLSFAKFGSVFCTDDPVTESMERSSPEVGRAQGIYVTSALDGTNTHVLVSIVFTGDDDDEHKGRSSLEIQGASAQFDRVREVAVVGGSGKFRFARGYATFETVYFDASVSYAIIQCNITIRYI